MWWKVIITTLICLCCWIQTVLAESIAVKPTTPIQISVVPESSVSAGSAASFVVRVSSALASNNLLIEVSQPPGTELLSGGMRWAGSILPGEVRELHFTLQLPAQEVPPINATATIQSASGAQLAAADVYRQVVALPAALKTTQGRKVSRQGRAVMEYSLR